MVVWFSTMAKKNNTQPDFNKRPPVVAIMGHIDHGKSTLLDTIRSANVVDGEAGGITQHISAYVVEHKNNEITFLDTPGHAAFAATRERGAQIADIAILIVSAEDGVKEQTMGAYEFIKNSKIPFVVAINKIDSPKADVDKTKNSLVENEIYLEGMGGDVSFAEISAKDGTNLDDLLDVILLAADVEGLKADSNAMASGVVLESSVDTKRGISATLIIKSGTLNSGDYIVSGDASAPVRIMEDFTGKATKSATFSRPVTIVGFDSQPQSGESFKTFSNKKEALAYMKEEEELNREEEDHTLPDYFSKQEKVPLIIKTDVVGSLEAIKHEISKMDTTSAEYKIILGGVGDVTEGDMKSAGADAKTVVVAFGVGVTRTAKDVSETFNIEIKQFDIIYELTEFLEEALESRRTRITSEKQFGEAKIIRVFSWTNKGGVIGGKVKEGELKVGDQVAIIRRDVEIGRATIKGLQQSKQDAQHVEEGQDFGMMIASKYEIAEGDRLRSMRKVTE